MNNAYSDIVITFLFKLVVTYVLLDVLMRLFIKT